MLKCVDLSRDLAETPAGEILMQLKVTALASTKLCVRDRWAGVGESVATLKMINIPPYYPTRQSIPEGANVMDQKAWGVHRAEPQEAGRSNGFGEGKTLRLGERNSLVEECEGRRVP